MWKQPGAYGAIGLMLFIAASIIDTYSRNVVVIILWTVGLLLVLSAAGSWLRPRLRSLLGPMTPFKVSLLLWAFFLISVFMLWDAWQDLFAGQTTLPRRRGPRPIITSLSQPILFYSKIGVVFSVFGVTMVASIYGLVKVTRGSRKLGE